ncbi:MAG: HAD family hydrolase [Nitrospiraceae bacterium]|nr:MAG: HAD family hydrolase [Nitrospiraceae bacterium]
MHKVDLLIFDLDGTLIESKRDIATAVNLTLRDLGLPVREQEEIFSFVGDGIKRLLRLSVGEENQSRYEDALRVFRGHYLAHCLDHTQFYPGIDRVLAHYAAKHKAVATNKSLEYTTRILDGLGAHHFAYVVGGDNGFGLKPEPGMLLKILDELKVERGRAVLIGDSTNDINGGHNAGIKVCAVGYGMGNREKMAACNPDWFIEKPEDLIGLFA